MDCAKKNVKLSDLTWLWYSNEVNCEPDMMALTPPYLIHIKLLTEMLLDRTYNQFSFCCFWVVLTFREGIICLVLLQLAHSLACSWSHLTMKLFTAKCHELRQHCENYDVKREAVHCYRYRHVKCLQRLHVIRACSWRWPYVVAGMSARFSKFAFVLFFYITNY